ncbi:tRNA(Ile)-lysidine synthetase-like protein [Inhella inkyongensis]|uniref:tRNA(Ile)-lysidine synthase n=1 Tax=Inhella inkyongensis TaxID=392593 RepID=A0A840RYQ5_9BURK|nr:tRNA lysidine(34) synthetase TilS [Inhella inkyongensis]MBB5203887.1 tRNA(Ile)-lysidine synthetase-like protein [Inhella inkyongensis]
MSEPSFDGADREVGPVVISGLHFGVAYSAGQDSTALLWVAARQAAALGLGVWALHVHHGLMPQADQWVEVARQGVRQLQAQGLPVSLRITRLAGAPTQGESVEAWARRERYRALAEMAQAEGLDLILLGQHAEDQAETVLLQALRGAGPAGLAAMPRLWQAQGLHWARPWLAQPRSSLRAALQASGLPSVQDPSNADLRYARARLRQQLMPGLVQAFPQAVGVLGEVARHAAQAKALGEEVAADDLPLCLAPDGALRHTAWSFLGEARRRNVLAVWLRQHLPQGVPVSLLDRLMQEWCGLGRRWPAPGGELRSVRRLLRFESSHQTK